MTRTWWRCGGQVPPHETLGDPPVEALQIQSTQLITQDGYGEDWVALNENPAKAHEEIMPTSWAMSSVSAIPAVSATTLAPTRARFPKRSCARTLTAMAAAHA